MAQHARGHTIAHRDAGVAGCQRVGRPGLAEVDGVDARQTVVLQGGAWLV